MSYWNRFETQRLSRRRLLVASSAAASAAALLAACGGSSNDSGSSGGDSNSLVAKPVDSTKQAQKGGTLKTSRPTDVDSFNPYIVSTPTDWHTNHVYSPIVRPKPGHLQAANGDVEPDLAESWEISEDKLQITFHIRANAKFDPRPPTNGRAANADDVVHAWKNYAAMSGRRADLANSVNPAASVTSVTATDPRTVVFKLAFPDSSVLRLLAANAERVVVLPVEADGGFDYKKDQRGSGPFMMTEYRPSQGFTYRKNPGYYEPDKPYIDGMEVTILSEYATALAQFKAGQVYIYDDAGAASLIRPEDVLQTKRDVPQVQMFQTDVSTATARLFYGFEGGTAKSPFVDQRVRQAYSMSLDRDSWDDAFLNVSNLQSQGLPVNTRYNTAVPSSFEGWWLDPQGKDFGENAKYYTHDIAEAKKLLSAAGFPNGVDLESHHIVTSEYGRDFPKMIEVLLGMCAEAGIRVKITPSGFNTDWRAGYADAKGKFPGIAYVNLTPVEMGNWLVAVYNKQGSLFKGFDVNGTTPGAGDPFLDDLTTKILREFDIQKRFDMTHDLQRYEAKTQYLPPFPGGATGFILNWPTVENRYVNRGSNTEELYLWLNNQKAPAV